MTTSKLLQFTNNTVTNLVNSVLLGNFLVQLGHFGTARRKLGVRLIRETENSKTCCRIYVGSPPQTTIINTRHTPPTNNYHYNHQQPLLPLQPQPPITPSKQVNHAEPPSPPRAPASLPRAPAPGCVLWAAFGATSPAHQPQRTSKPATTVSITAT